jgi:hypothetical protein
MHAAGHPIVCWRHGLSQFVHGTWRLQLRLLGRYRCLQFLDKFELCNTRNAVLGTSSIPVISTCPHEALYAPGRNVCCIVCIQLHACAYIKLFRLTQLSRQVSFSASSAQAPMWGRSSCRTSSPTTTTALSARLAPRGSLALGDPTSSRCRSDASDCTASQALAQVHAKKSSPPPCTVIMTSLSRAAWHGSLAVARDQRGCGAYQPRIIYPTVACAGMFLSLTAATTWQQ